MAVDYEIPTWLIAYIQRWIDYFDLETWDIKARLEMTVNENPKCMAWCDRNASYNQAWLTFRADVEDTAEWRRVVLHEMIHIVLARVDHFVFDAIIPGLYDGSQNLARVGYNQHLESSVQRLTETLWRLTKEAT